MATSIENAVMNNVLCYIGTARHVLSDQNIVSACIMFYNETLIKEAKEILFNCAVENMTKRRGQNKAKSDVEDILELFKKLDDDSQPIPQFLCNGYAKMPPSSGFEVITEHLVGLVTEVNNLKEDLKNTENARKKEFSNMKSELKGMFKQGSSVSVNSQTSTTNNKSTEPMSNRNNSLSNSSGRKSFSATTIDRTQATNKKVNNGASGSNSGPHSSSSHNLHTSSNLNPRAPGFVSAIAPEATANKTPSEEVVDAGEYTVAMNKSKRRKLIRGEKMPNGAFKGVSDTRDLYIGRCDPNVQEKDLVEYVKNNIEIDIINSEVISKTDSNVKSFRISVLPDDAEKLLNAAIWPENVRVRRYFRGTLKKFQ